jgi:uncharacterized tellurite resistance protein B-like protein
MLSTLQQFFDELMAASPDQAPAAREHALHLAAAVLLVEVMRADPTVDPVEREAVFGALRRRFTLTDDELALLVESAEAKVKSANDYFQFTSRINDHFNQPEKIALVEAMWQVAYADGLLDANENHVISKVAELLHVTHGEYIAAKLHAKQAAGRPP